MWPLLIVSDRLHAVPHPDTLNFVHKGIPSASDNHMEIADPIRFDDGFY